VVTANLPIELAKKLDTIARRIDRTRSWIIRQAVAEWLAEEDRRHHLTLEALADVDAGRMFTTEEVESHFAEQRGERAKRA
jgi:predicted transcriptional regulator